MQRDFEEFFKSAMKCAEQALLSRRGKGGSHLLEGEKNKTQLATKKLRADLEKKWQLSNLLKTL